ncbi:MAG: peptidase family protein [Thermoleophilia bacterium]|nr:peptidase family protein [Thermoleophilia bacterium]
MTNGVGTTQARGLLAAPRVTTGDAPAAAPQHVARVASSNQGATYDATAAAGDTPDATPNASPQLARVLREERRQLELAQHTASVQAPALDASLSEEQKATLVAQQDAFLASKAGDVPPGIARPGALPADVKPSITDLLRNPASDTSNRRLASFLARRDNWVDPSGDVWNVQKSAVGSSVVLERRNDPDGVIGRHPFQPSSVHAGRSAEDAAAQFDGSITVSSRIVLQADGSSTNELERSLDGSNGVSRGGIDRIATDGAGKIVGTARIVTLAHAREDGTMVRVIDRQSEGSYAPDAPGQEEHFQRVTYTDARGKVTGSSTGSPADVKPPRTLTQLRDLQDKLSSSYGTPVRGAYGVGGTLTPTGEEVDAFAAYADSMVNQGANLDALFEGAIAINRDHPELVTKYGDETLAEVQRDLTEWGARAADGNSDVDRNWRDPDVVGNAYYDPRIDKMDFGVGKDGVPFALSQDVIAHEFTHRLVGKAAPDLESGGQGGALNESVADTIAAASDSDWLVGEDIWKGGIRDMSKRATIADYDRYGDVHDNAKVPNYAAYLIGSKVGHADMGAIYTRAITRYLTDDADFTELATDTYRASVDLFGAGSSQTRAVRDAWDSVLELDGSTAPFPGAK